MKTIGKASRFFLTRYWVKTRIGPYVVTTTEIRPGLYETSVTWGEGGLEVEEFDTSLAFEPTAAPVDHETTCRVVEEATGLVRSSAERTPAA